MLASLNTYFRRLSRANTSPATARAATRTATTGSQGASTTSSTCRVTGWAPPKSRAALVAHPKGRKPRLSAIRTTSKGRAFIAYVTLMSGIESSEDLRKELVAWSAQGDRPFASPGLVQFASPDFAEDAFRQKIMRRDLTQGIAENEYGSLGDTSTHWPIPPSSMTSLANRQNRCKG